METRFRFIVSYDLQAEYEEIGTGRRYLVRHGCHHGNTRDDYLPTVKAEVGTVRCRSWGKLEDAVHDFPPRDVVEYFSHADGVLVPLVGARFSADWQIEYDGPVPETVEVWGGSTTMLRAWEEHCARQTAAAAAR